MTQKTPTKKQISDVMRAIGSRGASAGGRARAAQMTPEERSIAARRASLARWRYGRSARKTA